MEPEGSFSWSQKFITRDSYLETHQFSPSRSYFFLIEPYVALSSATSCSKPSLFPSFRPKMCTLQFYSMRALTDPAITFSAFFFNIVFSNCDNVVLVGKRISPLVCTVDRKAELRECDVE